MTGASAAWERDHLMMPPGNRMPDYMKPARGWQAMGRKAKAGAATICGAGRTAFQQPSRFWESFARHPAWTGTNLVFCRLCDFRACIGGGRVYRQDIADLTINLRAIKKYS